MSGRISTISNLSDLLTAFSKMMSFSKRLWILIFFYISPFFPLFFLHSCSFLVWMKVCVDLKNVMCEVVCECVIWMGDVLIQILNQNYTNLSFYFITLVSNNWFDRITSCLRALFWITIMTNRATKSFIKILRHFLCPLN